MKLSKSVLILLEKWLCKRFKLKENPSEKEMKASKSYWRGAYTLILIWYEKDIIHFSTRHFFAKQMLILLFCNYFFYFWIRTWKFPPQFFFNSDSHVIVPYQINLPARDRPLIYRKGLYANPCYLSYILMSVQPFFAEKIWVIFNPFLF